jgi:hypothetical protein
MSEPTNWKAFGEKVQLEATAQAQKQAEALKAKEQHDALEKQQQQAGLIIAIGKLQELKSEAVRIVDEFNSGAKDQAVRLNVIGGAANTFSIMQGYGSELVKFEAEPNQIEVTSERSGMIVGGTMEVYGIDDGKFTIRNGAGLTTAEQIVDYAIRRLLAH